MIISLRHDSVKYENKRKAQVVNKKKIYGDNVVNE